MHWIQFDRMRLIAVISPSSRLSFEESRSHKNIYLLKRADAIKNIYLSNIYLSKNAEAIKISIFQTEIKVGWRTDGAKIFRISICHNCIVTIVLSHNSIVTIVLSQ